MAASGSGQIKRSPANGGSRLGRIAAVLLLLATGSVVGETSERGLAQEDETQPGRVDRNAVESFVFDYAFSWPADWLLQGYSLVDLDDGLTDVESFSLVGPDGSRLSVEGDTRDRSSQEAYLALVERETRSRAVLGGNPMYPSILLTSVETDPGSGRRVQHLAYGEVRPIALRSGAGVHPVTVRFSAPLAGFDAAFGRLESDFGWQTEGTDRLFRGRPRAEEALAALANPGARVQEGFGGFFVDSPNLDAGGGVYRAPRHGFSLTWAPTVWTPYGEDVFFLAGDEAIGLSMGPLSGSSVVAVVAAFDAFDYDLDDCGDDYLSQLDGSNLVGNARPSDGPPLPDTGDEGERGLFRGEYLDGGEPAVAYVECRPIAGGAAVLRFAFVAPADRYEAELPAFEELIGGVELPPPDKEPEFGGIVPASGADVAATVVIEDVAFSPSELAIAADRPATIAIENRDDLPHTFTVAELGVHVEVPPGQTRYATVEAPAGTYRSVCEVPGHAEVMSGTLVVEGPEPEATPAATPPTGQTPGTDADVVLEGYDVGWRTADQAGPAVALTVPAGGTIELVNVGAASHNFLVEALGIDQDMPAGYSGTIQIPPDAAPGTYEFICDVPGHANAGMRGTLTIT